MVKSKTFNQEQQDQVIAMYNSGLSAKKIYNHFKDICNGRWTVYHILKNSGARIKNRSDYNIVDHDYFEDIDIPEKAYFLGLLLTDGTVSSRDNEISLSLKIEDKYILEKFQSLLGPNAKIYESTVNTKVLDRSYSIKMARLTFWSTKIKNDLAKYGVVPRKSFSTYLPSIKDELMSHLLRGILDGDGSIIYNPNLRRSKQISFFGTFELCKGIRDFLVYKLIVFGCKISSHSSLFAIRWSAKEDLKKIFDYLYKDSEGLRLERKYIKAIKIKESVSH